MPRITALEPSRRDADRVRLHLDGAFHCRLSRDLVRREGLSVGEVLSEARAAALAEAAEGEEATNRALRYLSHRSRSRFEVERHLRSKGYGKGAVARALERLDGLGYLDDRAFAAAWARDRIRLKPRAAARIRAELRRRGVSAADAEAGVSEAFGELGVEEGELLERAARERWRALRDRDPEVARRRLLGYLARRGFGRAESWRVTERLLQEDAEAGRPPEPGSPAGPRARRGGTTPDGTAR